jgi:hypothetical protein
MSATARSAPGARLADQAAWVLPALALAALGWLWHQDRARAWRPPVLGAPLVRLAAPADTALATWLVAVNPDCPHCLQALARRRAHPPRGAQVGALIVDAPRPSDPSRLAEWRVAPVWWDARGSWRREWGHRVYGEVLCFDARGRYLATLPPE